MNVKEWADALNGREYGNWFTKEEREQLQADGIVAAFAYSDDLCEFYGAVDDEVGCFEGNDIWLNPEGKILNNDDSMYDHFHYRPDDFPEYEVIHVRWHDKENPCWTFETDIKHETFNIMEDGEVFCVGIVFRLADVAPKKTNFDKIKAMTAAEFAGFIRSIYDSCFENNSKGICPESCPLIGTNNCAAEGIIEWLESEAE